MKNIPILTFIPRVWLLVVFAGVANFLTLWQRPFFGHTLFETCGAVLYVPAVASVVALVALLIVHLFFRQTIDADAHNGKYLADWQALTPAQRVYAATALRVGIIVAIAIVAASVGR